MAKHAKHNGVAQALGGPGGEQADIMAVYQALKDLYPDAQSELLEPWRDNPVDVLVATILSQLPTIPSAAGRFQNSNPAFLNGRW